MEIPTHKEDAMTETPGSTNEPSDDEPIDKFDETNGLAGNLDGDDGGAEVPDNVDELHVIPNLLADPADDYDESAAETGYSSEGAE
jgi:hypothetical protein